MKELDNLDRQMALNNFLAKMNKAEESIRTEGTVSAADLRKELGIDDLKDKIKKPAPGAKDSK